MFVRIAIRSFIEAIWRSEGKGSSNLQASMIHILLVFLAGVAVIMAVLLAFYFHVGADLSLSNGAQDWALFGDYFGGVAGALLSFLSILLIVYTIHLQSRQIESAQVETLKRDLLQYVSKADEEIERWLQRKLSAATHDSDVEFGDIVWGLVKPNDANQDEFVAAVTRLHKLTCTYCASIGLYKDNINTHFIFQHHSQKAEDLIAFLESHQDRLSSMAGPSLAFCKLHVH